MDTDTAPAPVPAPYPALRLVLLFAGGIVWQRMAPMPPFTWLMLFGGVLLMYLVLTRLRNVLLIQAVHTLLLGSYCLTVFLAGGCMYAMKPGLPETLPADIGGRTWTPLEVQGELLRTTRSPTGKLRMDIWVDRTWAGDSLAWQVPWGLRAIADSADWRHGRLPPGSRLRLAVTLYPPPEGRRNPRAFDDRSYLGSLEIDRQAGIDSLLSAVPPAGWNLSSLRGKALELVEHNFSTETAPLAKALLLGHKGDLDRGERVAFSRAGLGHIMAVSGLHVGFLLAPLWWVFPLFWASRYGRALGLCLLTVLLVGYAGITGFSASVTRASLTGGCLMYARLFHRLRNPLNLTAAAALIILIREPAQLFGVGFQLSFTAVFIILLLLPLINRLIPGPFRYRWTGNLMKTAMISVLVPVGLYPLLAHYFGEFSLVGPLANILVLPLLFVLVPCSLFLMAVSLVFPGAGMWLNVPGDHGLRLLGQSVEALSSLPWSWISTAAPPPFLFALWAMGILLLASLHLPRFRWKILVLLLLLAVAYRGSQVYRDRIRKPELRVLFFDVGQGDAALVRTPGNRNLLIDTGRWEPDYDSGRHVIIPYLRAAGIDSLHAVFLSHPHADHIGGMPSLLASVEIGAVYHTDVSYDSELYRRYREQVAEKKIPYRFLAAGDRVPVDPSLRILVYGPLPGRSGSDPNEQSLVIELIYGETEFLFMGDAGMATELDLVTRYGDLMESGLLKAGHHGGPASSSAPFLRTVNPEIAVVSAGRYNAFGHPDSATFRRLSDQAGRVFVTGRDRALLFRSDGERIRRIRWR